jgi:hypothetical protein
MKIALVAAFAFALAPAAFAKGGKHHCVGSDGSDMASATTKKECKKAGGKWEKMKKSGGGTGDTTSPSGSTQPK